MEQEFFFLGPLGSQGSQEKKVDLRNSEQLLMVVFSTCLGQKKIGYLSNFNFECDTERGFKESLSITLGV